MTQRPEEFPYQQIAVAFQGGGALGAYHVGAYKALHEAGYDPDVVSGISIGAFTAALVAGNDPDQRVEKLRGFWEAISWPDLWAPYQAQLAAIPGMLKFQSTMGFWQAVMFGQPNFFAPRIPTFDPQPPFALTSTSYYDTSPMIATLREFVDFRRINAQKTHLLLGAVKVTTGELKFFDNRREKYGPIGPEHVIASGSLPPGFPGTRVGDHLYWDGGCVSNTPIEGIYERAKKVPTLAFMIDLFNAEGDEPANMDEVTIRQTEILYASRTAHHIEYVQQRANHARHLSHVISRLPDQERPRARAHFADQGVDYDDDPDHLFDVVHLVLNPPADTKVSHGDADFSRAALLRRAEEGYADMMAKLPQVREYVEARAAELRVLGAGAEGEAPPPVRSKVFRVGRRA